jgi:hypothetical protein
MSIPASKKVGTPVVSQRSEAKTILGAIAIAMATTAATKVLDFVVDEAHQYLSDKYSYSFTARANKTPRQYLCLMQWVIQSGLMAGNKNWAFERLQDWETDLKFCGRGIPYGNYYRWYKGAFVVISKNPVQSPADAKESDIRIAVKIWLDDQGKVAKEISDRLSEIDDSGKVRVSIVGNRWNSSMRPPRSLDSVILNGQVHEDLMEHLNWFLGAKEQYNKLGIPYKTGILLEGPPGTGKTSLARAIATHTGFELSILKITSKNLPEVETSLSNVPPRTVVLMEEIDMALNSSAPSVSPPSNGTCTTERETPFEAPFDAAHAEKHLLNGLDGVLSPEGVIFIMTSNHGEMLSKILVRPGRIDLKLHIGYFTDREVALMAEKFGVPLEQVMALPKEVREVPADLQVHLMQMKQKLLNKPEVKAV